MYAAPADIPLVAAKILAEKRARRTLFCHQEKSYQDLLLSWDIRCHPASRECAGASWASLAKRHRAAAACRHKSDGAGGTETGPRMGRAGHRAREKAGTADYGKFQTWLAFPVQSQISNWVPGVVDHPVSSRHLPDCGLYSDPLDCGMKTCAAVLLQSYRSTFVPFAVPPPLMSMHLPSARRVLPACTTVHCCALLPLHVYTWTGVKFAEFAPCTSTHSPA